MGQVLACRVHYSFCREGLVGSWYWWRRDPRVVKGECFVCVNGRLCSGEEEKNQCQGYKAFWVERNASIHNINIVILVQSPTCQLSGLYWNTTRLLPGSSSIAENNPFVLKIFIGSPLIVACQPGYAVWANMSIDGSELFVSISISCALYFRILVLPVSCVSSSIGSLFTMYAGGNTFKFS